MVKAIVGANWGDEGEGKITDMLAEESDIIVRFQGGANAGHTIINDYGKFALHLLPSGVFYNHTTSVIGNGVALNIPYRRGARLDEQEAHLGAGGGAVTVGKLPRDPHRILRRHHPHRVLHLAGQGAVQGKDQLPLTVGMRRNILLRLHHPDTKGNGRFVATVRFIAIQPQSNHHLVRY